MLMQYRLNRRSAANRSMLVICNRPIAMQQCRMHMTTRHRAMTTTGSTEQPAAFSDGVPNKKDVRCAWSDSVVQTTSLPRHTAASESQIPSLYSDPTCGPV